MHKHVFLVGKYDSVAFKEMLTTKLVRVYLHDCDEYMAETSEVKFSTGQATFTFKDFLRPFCHELKLRSDVFPMKREEIDNTQNLDLNTTAKKNEKTVEKFSPYLINSTYCVLQANLSYPIGSFNLDRELALIAAKDEAKEEMRRSHTQMKKDPAYNFDATGGLPLDDVNGAIYERMVIIVPYKAASEVKQI